jgi:predicted GTPase
LRRLKILIKKILLLKREEYERYVRRGVKILAGVDYGKILRKAEEIADVII